MKITNPRFLALFSLLIFTWAFVYQHALLGMEDIWSRSDTFAHGYFILPISLWLLWRDKVYLLSSQVASAWLPVPILIGSLFVWLFSYAADINVLGQLSAVVSLICLIWIMIGNKLAWRYKFPLAYLLFAVPMGESLIPWLQDVTAWFTVAFLKLNGIPVFVDGLYIQIPTGMFEVAVACSGIRYLIASIAVGTLFSYLTYTKPHKQVVFIVFSMFLPILANGIRAYGIVAIAYYSDMKYATGVDHLIYGWLFFGLVIMLMFWFGGKFADAPIESQTAPQRFFSNDNRFVALPIIASLALLVATNILNQGLKAVDVTDQPLPLLIANDDRQVSQLKNWGINFVYPMKESKLSFSSANNTPTVELYLASYANKQQQGELINDLNELYFDPWVMVNAKTVSLKIDETDAQLSLLNLTDSYGQKRLVLYSYIIGEKISSSENKMKLYQALTAIFKQQHFGEIIAVSSLYKESQKEGVELLLIDTFKDLYFKIKNIEHKE
jgi:exosortase A